MRRAPSAVLLAVSLSLACSQSGTKVPAVTVAKGFLRDAQGRALVLRGANVSGKAKAPPYFDFQGPADLARMRPDWGMNAIRFLVLWSAIEPAEGRYDEAYLDAVAQRIGWARDAGLYVVLDMHQDVFGIGFASGGGDGAPLWACDAQSYATFQPTTPWFFENLSSQVSGCYDGFWQSDELQAHYAEAWRRLAARLAGYDDVIGFDVMNETYWGSYEITHFEQDRLEPLYERVVPVVRSAAPAWIAFLEPSSSRNLGGTTNLTPPSFGDFVYAPHSYDRNAESGNGFDPADVPAIVANVAALAEEARALGGALWIGEYGGSQNEPGIAPYMAAQYDAAGAVAASTMYWDYTMGGYGLLNPDGSEAQPLVDTLVRPYPELVAGTPVSWSFDAPTATFTTTYHPDRTIAGPSVIVVPARVYPAGYSIACGGCSARVDCDTVVIDDPGPGDPVVVTLSP
ncbi:MAG: cellulase family glycosylhydrolase [Polyangiaceae bacterium]